MSEQPFSPTSLQRAVEDHEILSECIESVRKVFVDQPRKAPTREITALRRLITQRVRDHFSYEEHHVFPSLLAGRPRKKVSRLVAELV